MRSQNWMATCAMAFLFLLPCTTMALQIRDQRAQELTSWNKYDGEPEDQQTAFVDNDRNVCIEAHKDAPPNYLQSIIDRYQHLPNYSMVSGSKVVKKSCKDLGFSHVPFGWVQPDPCWIHADYFYKDERASGHVTRKQAVYFSEVGQSRTLELLLKHCDQGASTTNLYRLSSEASMAKTPELMLSWHPVSKFSGLKEDFPTAYVLNDRNVCMQERADAPPNYLQSVLDRYKHLPQNSTVERVKVVHRSCMDLGFSFIPYGWLQPDPCWIHANYYFLDEKALNETISKRDFLITEAGAERAWKLFSKNCDLGAPDFDNFMAQYNNSIENAK